MFVDSGEFLWNAGIFIWSVNTIVNAFRIYQPTMSKIFESMLNIYGTDREQEEINRRFPECESISVDYAIMEKAEEIFVCPADFGWSDLGTWGSLHMQSKKDLYGNACIGQDINLIESHNCIVHTTQEKRACAFTRTVSLNSFTFTSAVPSNLNCPAAMPASPISPFIL